MPRKTVQPLGAEETAKTESPKVVGGFRLPASASPATIDPDTLRCPVCGKAMWDARFVKRNPKAPDFRCTDGDCEGVIWPRRGVVYARPDTAWTLTPEDVDTAGTHWAILTSADKSCAVALGTTPESRAKNAMAHWGVAWSKATAKFAETLQGDARGCWCRICQRNNCAGANRARKALQALGG